MKLDIQSLFSVIIVGILGWAGVTLLTNSHAIVKIDTELHHIDDNVAEIKNYWREWSNGQENK